MRVTILLVIIASFSAPAAAQSPYVSASLGVDVSRFDSVESPGTSSEAGGEAMAFSLRLGAPLGARWGVELAYTHPSEIESNTSLGYPIPYLTGVTTSLPGGIGGLAPPSVILPPFDFGIETERRNTTLDTVACITQTAGSRIDIVYLAGLSFSRITETVSYSFPVRLGIALPATSTRTTTYGVGPVAGFEARIGLTDHVMIVPGVRLHAIGGTTNGWLVRAAAGLGWTF